MKSKIKEALKTEYVNLGLGEKALDGVAGLLLAMNNITDESQIATAIKGAHVKELLTSIQSEGDKARQAKADAEKALNDYKVAHPEIQDPLNPPAPTNPPAPAVTDPKAPLTLETLLSSFKEVAQGMVNPIQERLNKLDAEKATTAKLQGAMALREALKLDVTGQKAWIDDAWTEATTSITDADTPQAIVDRFKTRFDGYMTRLGANGYVPVAGSGSTEKSSAAKIVEAIENEAKTNEGQAQTVTDRLGLGKKD